MDINLVKDKIEELLFYAQQKLGLNEYDKMYARNILLDEFNFDSPSSEVISITSTKEEIIETLCNYAIEIKKIQDTPSSKLFYETKLFGIVTPSPSQIIEKFDVIAGSDSIEKATDWLFELSKNNNYLREIDINKNIKWSYTGEKGDIQVTINLSKPEKDPKEIKKASTQQSTTYPKCTLCQENIGFRGGSHQVAKQSLRYIPIPLNDEEWFFQYSPYQYFDHHLIVISKDHRPMHVDQNTIRGLLDFVDIFPSMFAGCNAALPIVGGSILSHDHYQGGNKVLPMMKSALKHEFTSTKFPDVRFYIVDWYNSVIRVESDNKDSIEKAVVNILNKWSTYSNESIDIIAATTEQHNAITPICRNENGTFFFDLVLRNNRTDEKHPFGIFHPTEDLHNIKKEGIGIIEVMGLFILPGRLKSELDDIIKILSGEIPLNFREIASPENALYKHAGLIAQLANDHGVDNSKEKAENLVTDYINLACEKILNTTAVFKNDEKGEKAFMDFMKKTLSLKISV